MNFEQFWKELQSELGQHREFETYSQRKKFRARMGNYKDGMVVFVTPPNSDFERPVRRIEFEGVWNNAKDLSVETRFVNRHHRLESFTNKNGTTGTSFNVSYTTTLIRRIVNNQEMT